MHPTPTTPPTTSCLLPFFARENVSHSRLLHLFLVAIQAGCVPPTTAPIYLLTTTSASRARFDRWLRSTLSLPPYATQASPLAVPARAS
jgi:hypothetical protein